MSRGNVFVRIGKKEWLGPSSSQPSLTRAQTNIQTRRNVKVFFLISRSHVRLETKCQRRFRQVKLASCNTNKIETILRNRLRQRDFPKKNSMCQLEEGDEI